MNSVAIYPKIEYYTTHPNVSRIWFTGGINPLAVEGGYKLWLNILFKDGSRYEDSADDIDSHFDLLHRATQYLKNNQSGMLWPENLPNFTTKSNEGV